MRTTPRVQLGMGGLGRMGANMVRRLTRGGHQCVVYDRALDKVSRFVRENENVTSASVGEHVEPSISRSAADQDACR